MNRTIQHFNELHSPKNKQIATLLLQLKQTPRALMKAL